MKIPKITIDQVKNYLGTELECELDYGDESYVDKLVGIMDNGDLTFANDQGDTHTLDAVKPVCYRLADLHNYMDLGGVMGLNSKFLQENILGFVTGNMRYHYYERLWQHHFWTGPQEYFDQGLLIDKMLHGKEVTNV